VKKLETLSARTVLSVVVAILILLSGQSATAQTTTMSKTDQQVLREINKQENKGKLAKRSKDSIFVSGLLPRPSVGREPQTCEIYAGLPHLNGTDRFLYGSGARGTCTSSAGMSVYLRQDRRFYPDKRLSHKNFNF